MGANTIAGRPSRAMTLAMVKVLPEPVTPSRVWNTSPFSTPSTKPSMAVGWSPAGGYGWYSSKGEPGNLTKWPSRTDSTRPASGDSDVTGWICGMGEPRSAGGAAGKIQGNPKA